MRSFLIVVLFLSSGCAQEPAALAPSAKAPAVTAPAAPAPSVAPAPIAAAPAAAAPDAKCVHGVSTALCARCNPKLVPAFKAKGDWCDEHQRPESQCAECSEELAKAGVK